MAKLIVCRDYKSKKDKVTEEKTIVGYKINLTKSGIEKAGLTEKDNLKIEYDKDKIIITKIK